MQLRTGYELIYSFPQPTPIILCVNIHDSRSADVVVRDDLTTEPAVPVTSYRDGFGNQCKRILAPQDACAGDRFRCERYRPAG
jgi:hypothetical protein